MIRLRAALLAMLAPSLTGCLLFMGTIDAYAKVEGVFVAHQTNCSIRILSEKHAGIRTEHVIAPGPLSIGFLYHGGERLSDFHAEVSCNAGTWRKVGPADAFATSPVQLGTITL